MNFGSLVTGEYDSEASHKSSEEDDANVDIFMNVITTLEVTRTNMYRNPRRTNHLEYNDYFQLVYKAAKRYDRW